MYNGICLPTPRGSGTNGFVQKNLAHVSKQRSLKPRIVAEPQEERGPNKELILHRKKREIEAKCMRLRKELEEERHPRIDEEVDRYRRRKLDELARIERDKERQQEREKERQTTESKT